MNSNRVMQHFGMYKMVDECSMELSSLISDFAKVNPITCVLLQFRTSL